MYKQHANFITILLVLIGLLFLIVVKDYIVPVVLAAIIAGLLNPTYKWFLKKLKDRKTISSLLTTFLFLLIIVIPTVFLITLIYNEAVTVSQSLTPILQEQSVDSSFFNQPFPEWVPFKEQLEPFKTTIYTKMGELAGHLGGAFMKGLSSLTQGTLVLFINLFVMLYALYYFFIESATLEKMIYKVMPLDREQTQLLITKTISISRATLKGALLVGIVQGALVGLSFWVAGIEESLFWGALAAIMSLIPSVGSAMVYVPAGVYLILTNNVIAGMGVLVWGFGVVSTIDNLLRPKLVGKDTELPDLIVLISTLGGIGLFGVSGLVLGPIISGLFLTLAKIYYGSLLEKG